MSKTAKVTAALNLNTEKWDSGLKSGKRNLEKFANDVKAMKVNGLDLNPAGGGFMAGMRTVIGKYAHLRAVVSDVAAVATRAAGAPAAYADMTDALTAVTGSAQEAKSALDFLASVSEEQKLEFEPLVEAYERMRALGYSAEQTRDFIREMGNAIEASGGGADQLTQVASALAKIQDKGELSAKALHAMGQSMPFLRTVMKEQFGAETAADIEKIKISSDELFDGLLRGLKRVETSKGGVLDALSPEYIASANRLRLGRAGTGVNPMLPDLPTRGVDAADPSGDAQRIAAYRSRAMKEEEAERQKKEAAAIKSLNLEEEKLDISKQIAQAETDGNKERQRQLEDQLYLLENTARMAKEMEVSEEIVRKSLERQIDSRRRIEEIKNEAIKKNEAYEQKIASLRNRGRGKAADKMEEAKTKEDRVKELMDRDRMSPADAARQANEEAKGREDAAYFERTGRVKMRGAVSPNTFSGIDDYNRRQDTGLEVRTPVLDSNPFQQRGFRPQTPNLDEARRQPAPRFPAGNDNNKGGTIGDMTTALKTGLATVTAKLEELKNSNAAPVADTVRPVNG